MNDAVPEETRFTEAQAIRALALREARQLIVAQGPHNVFAGSGSQTLGREKYIVDDMVELAEYIVSGEVPTDEPAKAHYSFPHAQPAAWIDEAVEIRTGDAVGIIGQPHRGHDMLGDGDDAEASAGASLGEGDDQFLDTALGGRTLPFAGAARLHSEDDERTEPTPESLIGDDEAEPARATEEEITRHAEKQGVSYADAWSHFQGLGYFMGEDVAFYEFNRTVPGEARD